MAGGINALSALTLVDVIQPLVQYRWPKAPKQDPKMAMIVFKVLGTQNSLILAANNNCSGTLTDNQMVVIF